MKQQDKGENMRNIKFRIWQPQLNQFKGSNVKPDRCAHRCMELDHGIWMLSSSDQGIIQQYTGLKDSHGTEIYEGDIVLACDDFADDCNYLHLYCRYNATNGWWIFSEKKDKGDEGYYWLEVNKDCVVVGNIFENPKLL